MSKSPSTGLTSVCIAVHFLVLPYVLPFSFSLFIHFSFFPLDAFLNFGNLAQELSKTQIPTKGNFSIYSYW
jgi:hypothetical protein